MDSFGLSVSCSVCHVCLCLLVCHVCLSCLSCLSCLLDLSVCDVCLSCLLVCYVYLSLSLLVHFCSGERWAVRDHENLVCEAVTDMESFATVHETLSRAIEEAEAKNADPNKVQAAKSLRFEAQNDRGIGPILRIRDCPVRDSNSPQWSEGKGL